ncbi:MAG: metallophosphoesterase [Polyangiales bacterium]|nr:metallophosphoesterase [Sandaracinaceae bacterium]
MTHAPGCTGGSPFDPEGTDAGGAARDGGVALDGGAHHDAGTTPDAAGPGSRDAGGIDAGLADVGMLPHDAGVDAGGPDQATSPDHGTDLGHGPLDAGTDQGADAGVDQGVDGGPLMSLCAPPTPGVVRFVALGDGGEGNDAQYQVGHAMAERCCELGCDLALYLGDNFYDDGVSSLEDMQFDTKFEMPYAELDIPFYVVLGNHDSGGLGGAGFEFWRGAIQVDYTNVSDKWTMPHEFYAFVREHVTFVGLDTNALMWSHDVAAQRSFVREAIANADTDWVIAFGHHPYISNGKHGDAGLYEGIPGVPIVSGGTVKSFFEQEICGNVDIYFSGHDHNRQWLPMACGTQHVVSGAAAKTTDFRGRLFGGGLRHDGPFNDDSTPGFFWGEIRGDTLIARFYDLHGTLQFETVHVR